MASHYLQLNVADVYAAVNKLSIFLTDVVGWEIAEDVSDTGDVRDVVLRSVGEPEVPNGFPRYIRIRNNEANTAVYLHTYETFTNINTNTGEVNDSSSYVWGTNDAQGIELVAVADLERVIIVHYPYTGTNAYVGYVGRLTPYHRANEHNYPNLVKGGSAAAITWYYSAAETNCFMIGPHGTAQHYYAVEPLNSTGLDAGTASDRNNTTILAAPVLINTNASPQRSELVGEPRGVYRLSSEVSQVGTFIEIDGDTYVVSVQSGVHMALGPIGTEPVYSITDPVPRVAKRAVSMLAHWDETTIQSVSGTVTAWNDKTGNGWDLIPGSTAPLHLTANQNGLDTIDCVTGDGFMELDVSAGAPISSTNPGTFYMVLITDSAPGENGRSPLDVTDGSFGPHHPWTTNDVYTDFGTTSRKNFAQNPSGVVHSWHVFSGVAATNNNAFYINDIWQYSTTSNTVSWRPSGASPWVIGGGQTGAYEGRIGELRLYDKEHDRATITYINQILKDKWGIA